MKKLDKIESLLEQCEKDVIMLNQFSKELGKIDKRLTKLRKYYHTDYREDYDKYGNTLGKYRILDQDSIWNVLAAQHAERLIILKSIVKDL